MTTIPRGHIPFYLRQSYQVGDEFGATRGRKTPHTGIDLIPTGPAVKLRAIWTSTVEIIGYSTSLGWYLVLKRVYKGHTYRQILGHCARRPNLRIGQTVRKRSVVAVEGATGAATGTHCHLGISVDGKLVNPRTHVKIKRKVNA